MVRSILERKGSNFASDTCMVRHLCLNCFQDTEHTTSSLEVSRELQKPKSPLLPIISEEVIEPGTTVP